VLNVAVLGVPLEDHTQEGKRQANQRMYSIFYAMLFADSFKGKGVSVLLENFRGEVRFVI